MTRSILEDAIRRLEDVNYRAEMHLGRVTLERSKAYLDGFRMGLRSAQIEFSFDLLQEATEARGWEFAAGPIWQDEMLRNGVPEEKIVEHAIQLFIDELRLMLRDLPE